tara:strand:+ start:995 stop:1243 length:249 start_codon:yes stop_codon:yes gene_type:complete
MKKIFIFIFLVFYSTNLLAEEPEYSDSLNKNINEYGWKIKNSKFFKFERSFVQIYTLTNKNYVLKCNIIYRASDLSTYCELP